MTLALLIMAVGGAWAQEETLLTTITPTAKEQASYSTATVATVSFSYTADGSSAYLANWGWWGYGWIATVTATEGYTITKCIFYDDANRTATDSEAPFVVETTEEDKTPRINDTPIDGGNMWSKGIKKIEVYGYKSEPAEPTEWSLTPDETGKTWTLDKMPASNIELQVEYFAESNLFLSKNALADKTNIAVTAGDLGVQFGNDGKSANTITEGTEMTVKYNGTKKIIGFKAEKKAAAAFAADEYNEASWDDTNKKLVFEKKKATTTPVSVANSDAAVTWGDGWYTVSGNVTITGNVTLTADAHLILQDGATLTINGQLDCRTNRKNLYIYGQKKGDGKLNVTNNSAIANNSSIAINSDWNYRIDIHGGEVTAASTRNIGLNTGYLAVYGGKLTATSGGGNGINFNNTIDVYGGVVEATSNATSGVHYGIVWASDDETLTVYGGKVTATGNGESDDYGNYGSGFRCYVKSGTSGIKFYFSDNGTTWGDGTSYDSATEVGTSYADAATKKRYAKAE